MNGIGLFVLGLLIGIVTGLIGYYLFAMQTMTHPDYWIAFFQHLHPSKRDMIRRCLMDAEANEHFH